LGTGDWELVFLLSTQHSALSSQGAGVISPISPSSPSLTTQHSALSTHYSALSTFKSGEFQPRSFLLT
ncbi:hypothetical protein, partial [Nostoc sp.]